MKIISWCVPPLKKEYKIPCIPPSFKIFGIEYNQNKLFEHVNKEVIKKLIKESFNKYLSLLDNPNIKVVEEIELIHLQINEILNNNKLNEVKDQFRILMTENNKRKNTLLIKLREICN